MASRKSGAVLVISLVFLFLHNSTPIRFRMAAVAEIKLFGKWLVCVHSFSPCHCFIFRRVKLTACRTFSDVEIADLALKVRFSLSKSHRVGSPRCDPQERHLSSPHRRKIPAQEIPQGPGGRLRFCVMPSARLWSASRTASCSTAATPVRR